MTRLLPLLILALWAPSLTAQPLYSVEVTHPSEFGGRANAINDAGVVGGTVALADSDGIDPTEAFLWQDGVVIWQGSFGIPSAGVGDVNEAGDAVGAARDPKVPFLNETSAFFRPAGGDMVSVPAPSLTGGYRQVAYEGGLNESGLVTARWRVVTSRTGGNTSPEYFPVVWDTVTDETRVLPTIDSLYGRSAGITEDGVVGGTVIPINGDLSHAARWTPGADGEYVLEDLGTIGTGTFSECNAINDAGVCFGEATTAVGSPVQTAIWEPGEPGRVLPMPDGAEACAAYDINENGDALGTCFIGREPRATVWIDEVPTVLEGVLDASGEGWNLERGYGINNLGWIVGRGTQDGVFDTNGDLNGFPFLLKPVGAVASDDAPTAPAFSVTAAPNPLGTAGTTLRVTLAAPSPLRADIYDVRGRRVRTLDGGDHAAGPASMAWDGRDADGRAVAPGVYLARVIAGDAVATVRVSIGR